jgi:hypothetical protein
MKVFKLTLSLTHLNSLPSTFCSPVLCRAGHAKFPDSIITVLKAQMRHADVRTTLKVYAHVIPQSQRESMERIAKRSIGTNVPNGTRAVA